MAMFNSYFHNQRVSGWDGRFLTFDLSGFGGKATSEMMQKVDEGAVGSWSLDLLDGYIKNHPRR